MTSNELITIFEPDTRSSPGHSKNSNTLRYRERIRSHLVCLKLSFGTRDHLEKNLVLSMRLTYKVPLPLWFKTLGNLSTCGESIDR